MKAQMPATGKNKPSKGIDNNYNDYIDTTNIQINKSARNKASQSKTNQAQKQRFGRVMALN